MKLIPKVIKWLLESTKMKHREIAEIFGVARKTHYN